VLACVQDGLASSCHDQIALSEDVPTTEGRYRACTGYVPSLVSQALVAFDLKPVLNDNV
jgi:hypothetical protein